MLSIWTDPAFMRNVGDRGVRNLEQAQEAMAAGLMKLYSNCGYGPFLLSRASDGAHLGICGLFKRDNLPAPDIGFSLLPAFYGQGYALEAAQAVREHARFDLNLPAITAIVDPANGPSIRLLEKLGMHRAGTYSLPGEEQVLHLYELNFD